MRYITSLACTILLLALAGVHSSCRAQDTPKVDSIVFHLYTDSLKKQVYNYINIDAKMSNGSWRPLSSRDVDFKSSYGKWDGNSLIIDTGFKAPYVDITATLKKDSGFTKSVRIYIKTKEEAAALKSEAEVLREYRKRNR